MTSRASGAAAFVQATAKAATGTSKSLSLSLPKNTLAGDLILVAFDYDQNSLPSSVTDSQGNVFSPVGNQLTSPGGARSRVYYAKNIKGGADTVTINLSANSGWLEVYLSEYAGVDKTNPIDAQAGATGKAGPVSSGNAKTTIAGDMIYGYCVGDWTCTLGSGFSARQTLNSNLIEDKLAGVAGTYAATGSATNGWTAQLVALKPASSGAGTQPTITSATAASGKVKSSLSYQISATNKPTSYGATGLPAGLAVNTSTGLISGTPTAAGTSSVSLSASNSAGTGHATLTVTIAATVVAPVITSATTASGTVAKAFSYQITATNSPTSYGATGLPAGLSINTVSGLISGTPTTAGTSSVSLSATNTAGTGHATLSITIAASVVAPVITGATTANGTVASAFSYQITATNSPTSYGASGLPAGLAVNTSTGLISGTPTAAGTSSVSLSATNSAGTGHATLTITIAAVSSQFIALSSNGKYLVNPATNQPVFLVAEQGFDLDQNLSDTDLETYLSDRQAKGFNLIWMAVIDNSYSINPPYDSHGNAPFNGGDFLNMQSAYFTHLDYVLNRLAAHGMSALLGPAFSGYPCGPLPSGYCLSMEAASDATMTAYGQYLGNRYKTFPNIIWMIGGDMDSSGDLKAKHNDIAVGIKSVDTVHLMTAENIRGQSSLDIWSGHSWLDLNGLYNLPSDIPTAAKSNFTRSDFLPEFMMEDWCENEHSETSLGLRTEGYWAVLSGAYLGRNFCNYPLYSFLTGWQAQLNSAGSESQSLLGKLFRSREHWVLAPDINHSVVTAGYGTGATLTTTARTSDGQSIIAYIPNGSAATITVNMTKITSTTNTVQGWWFDPQTGTTQNLGVFGNSGTQNFRPPDSNDWVLVLDDANAKLPAPGTSTLVAH